MFKIALLSLEIGDALRHYSLLVGANPDVIINGDFEVSFPIHVSHLCLLCSDLGAHLLVALSQPGHFTFNLLELLL